MKKYFVFCLLFAIFLVSCGKESVNYDRTPEATLNVGSVAGTNSNAEAASSASSGAPLPSEPEKELSIQVGGILEVQNVKVSDHKKNVTITFGDGKGGTKEVTAKINNGSADIEENSGVVIGRLLGTNGGPLTVYVYMENGFIYFAIFVDKIQGSGIQGQSNVISILNQRGQELSDDQGDRANDFQSAKISELTVKSSFSNKFEFTDVTRVS
jgi:hypothetical protein